MTNDNADRSVYPIREGRLGWIVLNRPEVRNALNLKAWQGIAECAEELAQDSEIRAIILRGATPEAFIAGADISEFPELRKNADQARNYRLAPERAVKALASAPKPVIAMISGVCVGGGVQVALACDVRLAARGTRFGVPAARLGLAYPVDAVAALVHTVGAANASDILLSGRLFDAEEALRMGLVNRLFEGDALENEARHYAERAAENAPLTMATAKAAIKYVLEGRPEARRRAVDEMVSRCFDSEDYREGVRAFIERRKPKFVGR